MNTAWILPFLFGFSLEQSSVVVKASHKVIKVAVIDTGMDRNTLLDEPPICPDLSRDFTGDNDPYDDTYGHGTNVSGLIQDNARSNEYCQVILKYISHRRPEQEALQNEIRALKYAVSIGVDIINFSGGGAHADSEERAIIKEGISKGIHFYVAAGNEHSDLNKYPYFPACYVGVTFVTSKDPSGKYHSFSNFKDHKFDYKKDCPNKDEVSENGQGASVAVVGSSIIMNGTSQATAIHTGKMVYQLSTVHKPQKLVKIHQCIKRGF